MATPEKAAGNPKVFASAASRKRGGLVSEIVKKSPAYDVIKEAEGKKKGGACGPSGAMAKGKMNRPRRAQGGGVGSNRNPLSSAHGTCSPPKANN